jgi:hypothetical protein
MARNFSQIGGPVLLIAGAVLGGLSAYVASDVIGTAPIVKGSPWTQRPVAVENPAEPYTVAHFLLEGRLPPPASQVTELTAFADQDGNRITSACVVELQLPPGARPRWWSIGVLGQTGSILSSDRAVAEPDGSIRISIASSPKPGNWIEAPGNRSYALIYSAAVSDFGAGFTSGSLPLFTITRGAC